MPPELQRRLAAMIIGIALSAAAGSPPAFAGAALPTPTAFANAMEVGDTAQAEAWLDAGLPADFLGARIGSGLMIGAWEGKIELMRLFLSRGANIDFMNANGETALTLAAWRGNLEAAQWLIERGARVNPQKRQWTALHYAVFAGHGEMTDYLLSRGADIDAVSTNGSSVLMMAVYEGREDMARRLIEKGADRTVRNDWGDAALDWAMRHDRLNLARMVASPEEFNIAVSQPKEKWGERPRSFGMSKELENLLAMRDKLIDRGQDTIAIDKRIAAERVRIVRAETSRQAPPRAASLEITASRNNPGEQSVKVIYDEKGKAVGYITPPATYFGTPKMPPRGNVKNY